MHVHHTFCTFLSCHCTTTAWNFLLSRFVEDRNTRKWHSFSPELQYSRLEFNSKPIRQHFVTWGRWNKLDKIWSTADLLFIWRFPSHLRRHRCCLSSPMHPLTLSSIMNMQAYALVLCSILRGVGGEGEGNIQVISVTFLTCLLRLTSATSRHASRITCLSWGSITSSIMLLISESSWDCCIASKTYSTSFELNWYG